MKKIGVLFILLTIFISYAHAEQLQQKYSIEQAYKAISHDRTQFTAGTAMPSDESNFLAHMFYLTDLLVAERVETLTQKTTSKKVVHNYDII